jgi:hypothetical protein
MKNSIQVVGHLILKKKLLSAVLLLALILGVVGSVQAGGIFLGDQIQTGTAIENDLFLSGENTTLDNNVNGNVLAFGPEVAINGDIDGNLFVIGNRVNLQGNVSGSVYSLGTFFQQMTNSEIKQSLYGIALDLSTEKGSTIGRDLWATALFGNVYGSIGRNDNSTIGPREIYEILNNYFNRSITGQATSSSHQKTNTFAALSVKPVVHYELRRALVRNHPSVDFPQGRIFAPAKANLTEEFLLKLKAFVTFLLVGGLAIWLIPAYFQRWVDKVRTKPLASAGYGLVVLINGYIMAVLLLLLIVALALVFFFLRMPFLGSIVLGGGLGSLVVAFATFLASTMFLSKAIVAFLAGFLILNKLWPGSQKYKIAPLLLGLILYGLIAAIPFIGWVVSFIFTLLGLGAIWLVWREKALPAESSQPAPVLIEQDVASPEVIVTPPPSPKKQKVK